MASTREAGFVPAILNSEVILDEALQRNRLATGQFPEGISRVIEADFGDLLKSADGILVPAAPGYWPVLELFRASTYSTFLALEKCRHVVKVLPDL